MPGKMARSDARPSVRVIRVPGSGQHLASVLQEGRENANIDAGLGFIWRISVNWILGCSVATDGAENAAEYVVAHDRLNPHGVNGLNNVEHYVPVSLLRIRRPLDGRPRDRC